MNPIIIPEILGKFKLSFKKIADKIRIIIGVRVTITPLFIGVESSKPLKNINMLIHMPKKATPIILE